MNGRTGGTVRTGARFLTLALLLMFVTTAGAQSAPRCGRDKWVAVGADSALDALSAHVSRLESRMDKSAGAAVAFLFGGFCALWAQNTKRNPWAWFFLGGFFNVIAVLVLLAKNADDLRARDGAAPVKSVAPILAAILGVLLLLSFFVLYWQS
jgi:hypothetical protein